MVTKHQRYKRKKESTKGIEFQKMNELEFIILTKGVYYKRIR